MSIFVKLVYNNNKLTHEYIYEKTNREIISGSQ
jgi:hypothetical protein